MTAVTTLDMETTKRCNLRCKYCYRSQVCRLDGRGGDERADPIGTRSPHTDGDMPLGVARRAVRWVIRQARSPRVAINFIGGEPLLAVNVVEEIMAFARRAAERKGIEIGFGGSTNCTLVDERILGLVRGGLRLNVSLDGTREAHGVNRVFEDGSSSARQAFEGASKLASAGRVLARMTVTPDTAHLLAAGVRHLRGYTSEISVSPDYSRPWGDQELEILSREWRVATDDYILAVAAGKPFYLSPLEKMILRRSAGRRPEHRCGAGRELIAVGVDGRLVPCHRMFGDGRVLLGDVELGVDAAKARAFVEFVPRLHAQPAAGSEPCAYCSACLVCVGGCPAESFARFGNDSGISSDWCAVQRILAREALRAYYLLTHDDDTAANWRAYRSGGQEKKPNAAPREARAVHEGGCCV